MKQLFDQKQYNKLAQLLQQAKKVLIIGHINPDGDAIGSSLGLATLLKQRVPQVQVVMPNLFPDFLKWIPGASDILIYSEKKKEVLEHLHTADVIFCVDFNKLERIEELGEHVSKAKAARVLIDHHPDPSTNFDLSFSHIPASSTAELVYRIAFALTGNAHIAKDAAEAIYCGIMTDTGSFSYASSDPELFRIVANLLECGIDKDRISSLVYDNFSVDRMKLLGYSLNDKMLIYEKYNAACIYLSRDELQRYNFKPGDTEGFVNLPLSIANIALSVLFVEAADHIKVSVRSRGKYHANKIALTYFNGGGHKNAAGGKLYCSLEDAVKLFESILPKYEAN